MFVCVLHIKPFFLPVGIQHNQCSCPFLFNRRRDTYKFRSGQSRDLLPKVILRTHVGAPLVGVWIGSTHRYHTIVRYCKGSRMRHVIIFRELTAHD